MKLSELVAIHGSNTEFTRPPGGGDDDWEIAVKPKKSPKPTRKGDLSRAEILAAAAEKRTAAKWNQLSHIELCLRSYIATHGKDSDLLNAVKSAITSTIAPHVCP